METLAAGVRTRIELVLSEGARRAVEAKLAQAGGGRGAKEAPAQTFLVKCGAVELKLTLPSRALAKSLREAVLLPFLKVWTMLHGRGRGAGPTYVRARQPQPPPWRPPWQWMGGRACWAA